MSGDSTIYSSVKSRLLALLQTQRSGVLKRRLLGFFPRSHLHQAARPWAVVLLSVLVSSTLCCDCLGRGQYASYITHKAECFVLYIERTINASELNGQIDREYYLRTISQRGVASNPFNPSLISVNSGPAWSMQRVT